MKTVSFPFVRQVVHSTGAQLQVYIQRTCDHHYFVGVGKWCSSRTKAKCFPNVLIALGTDLQTSDSTELVLTFSGLSKRFDCRITRATNSSIKL